MLNIMLYFFSGMIEMCALGIYCELLFPPRHSRRMRIILLCVFCIILFIAAPLDNPWINTCLFSSILGFYIYTQFQITWYICLFHTLILTALDSVTEMVVFGFLNYYYPNTIPSLTNAPAHFLLVLFSKPLYLFIVQIMGKILHNKNQSNQSFVKSDYLLFPIPLISIGIMLTFTYWNKILSTIPKLNWLIFICASGLLLLNLLVFGINQYNQKRQQEYTQMQLLCQKESDMAEYYRALVQQDENQRVLIHDIRRHLASIDTLAAAQETDKIHIYIQQLQTSSSLRESLQRCDIPLLNAILCRYANQCETQQISFHTDIRSHTVDFLTDADLTALFCNLLDNALRAAAIPDCFIELRTYTKTNSPFSIITVVNSCLTDPFSGPGRTPVSSKPDQQKHGFGLKSVQRVIDRYDGAMKMYFDLPTLTFHTILTLRPEKA